MEKKLKALKRIQNSLFPLRYRKRHAVRTAFPFFSMLVRRKSMYSRTTVKQRNTAVIGKESPADLDKK